MPVTDWSDLFPHTIVHSPFNGRDDYGKPTYGTAMSYSARVLGKQVNVRDPSGNEVLARTIVWILGTPTVTPEDQIQLPDGTTPPVLSVDSVPDEDGAHHVKAFLG